MPASRTCPTPGCPAILPPGTPRCAACQRDYEQRRGSSTQRGYDAEHRRQSERAKAAVRAGRRVLCWRCREPITDPDDLHNGHVGDRRDTDTRRAARAPEHVGCNLSNAGRAGAAIRNG